MLRNEDALIRYAVVGAGNIAQVAVLPAFENAAENSVLAAIISSDPEKRAALSARYRVEHVGDYAHLEEVLDAAAIDAVYVTVPNTEHREMVERCATAGVHVLVEKPMAMTPADCEAMIDSCAAAGVKLMVAYRLHFEETNLRAIDIVKKGVIGEPRYFSSVFSHEVHDGGIRTHAGEGGALYDLGVYCVNASRFLFGAEPVSVTAMQVKEGDVDSMTSAILRFPGDRIAQFVVDQRASEKSELHIVGTSGDVRLEPAYDYSMGLAMFTTVADQTKKRSFKKRDQFGPELVYFSRCILEDKEPEPNGIEGLADVRILDAIARSADEGRTVALAPFEKPLRPTLAQEIDKPAVEAPDVVNAPSPSR